MKWCRRDSSSSSSSPSCGSVQIPRRLCSCFRGASSGARSVPASASSPSTSSSHATAILKNRLSSSLAEQLPFLRETHIPQPRAGGNGGRQNPHQPRQRRRPEERPNLLLLAGSLKPAVLETSGYASSTSTQRYLPQSPPRSTVVGTLYGNRRGRVTFCVQQDPATPPPFLLGLSIPTHRLAGEMQSGVLRIALECDFRELHAAAPLGTSSGRPTSLYSAPIWRAYCNGRRIGYAVKRKPTERDRAVLESLRTTSAGAGVLSIGNSTTASAVGNRGESSVVGGEVLYMRACYERVVGSRDSEAYHLINPDGGATGCSDQQLSVFLLRTG